MNTKNYGMLASISMAIGGLVALLFGIQNLISRMSPSSITYGVLLLVVMAIAITIVILYNTKFSDQKDRLGFYFAVMPIWLIEAVSLIAVDYGSVWFNTTSLIGFILTVLIIVAGAIGFGLVVRGKIIPGRVFSLIFLVIDFVGTILGLANGSTSWVLALIGNIFRLFAIAFVIAVLFMTKGLTPLSNLHKEDMEAKDAYAPAPMLSKPAPSPVVKEKAPLQREETVFASKAQESKQTMREKLLEAKQLYEEGLISEEEYTTLKKKVIDNQ